MKKQLTEAKKRELILQQRNEIQNLEENHKQEINEFNTAINLKLSEVEERMKKQEEEIIWRHNKEMNDLIMSLEEKISKHVVFSREFNELKKAEASLVKQQR